MLVDSILAIIDLTEHIFRTTAVSPTTSLDKWQCATRSISLQIKRPDPMINGDNNLKVENTVQKAIHLKGRSSRSAVHRTLQYFYAVVNSVSHSKIQVL